MASERAANYLKCYGVALMVSGAALGLPFLTSHSGFIIAAIATAILAWGISSAYAAFWLKGASQSKTNEVYNASAARKRVVALVDDVNALVEEELGILRSTLEQIRGLASDAVETLSKSFNGLNNQVQAQSKLVHSTLGNMMGENKEKDSKQISLYEFVEEFGQVIEYFISLTEDARRQRSIVMGYFDEMTSHIGLIIRTLDGLETKKPDGEIHQQVKDIERCLENGRRSLGDMASRDSDRNLAILAKGRLDITRDQLKQTNALLSENLSLLDSQISTDVGMAVRSLQFEDIVNQLAKNASIRLDRMGALIGRLKAKVGRLRVVETDYDLDATQVVREIQSDVSSFLEDLRDARNTPVQQASVSAGSVELF